MFKYIALITIVSVAVAATVPGKEKNVNPTKSKIMNKTTDKKFTIKEAHKFFAIDINGKVWNFLQKKKLTQDEKDEMEYAAHASCYHWLKAGTIVEKLRGEWLISKIYSELGYAEPSLRHANRCYKLTQANLKLVKDFDIAYAYECMARANAVNNNKADAQKYYTKALNESKKFKNKEDLKLFLSDLKGGNWNKLILK